MQILKLSSSFFYEFQNDHKIIKIRLLATLLESGDYLPFPKKWNEYQTGGNKNNTTAFYMNHFEDNRVQHHSLV